jgi:DNA-binding transcriptional LysR family regulator
MAERAPVPDRTAGRAEEPGERDDPLSIRQLGVLVALVEQGSFGRAARALGLSQSTVSGHLAEFEDRVGQRLVDRNRKGVVLTAAGKTLLPHAREALRAEAGARRALADLSGLLTGTLRIGGSTIPASHLLPEWIAGFHRGHPRIGLHLFTGDTESVLAQVRSGEVEVGVVGGKPGRSGLLSTEVGEDRLVLVVAPGHPFAKRRSVAVSEAVTTPLVLREKGSGTRAATMASLTTALGEDAVHRLEVVLEVGSTEGLKAAVRSGLGAAFASELAVRTEVATKTLVAVPVDGFDARRIFRMVTREEARLSPAARAFRDHVLAAIR